MLAKPVTGWEKSGLRRRSDGVVLASFLYSGQTIQCGADDVSLFGQPDFCGHGVADLLAAYYQHPAPAQLLAGHIVKMPLFIGVVQSKVLPIVQFGADGDVSKLVNFPAVPLQKAWSRIRSRADVSKGFFHSDVSFLCRQSGRLSMWIACLGLGLLSAIHMDSQEDYSAVSGWASSAKRTRSEPSL